MAVKLPIPAIMNKTNVPIPKPTVQQPNNTAVPKPAVSNVPLPASKTMVGQIPKPTNATQLKAPPTSIYKAPVPAAQTMTGAIPQPTKPVGTLKPPTSTAPQAAQVMDYNVALAQAMAQTQAAYQQGVTQAQQQGWQNNLDAGELASARGGAHSGLAADLQNKVNINTSNAIKDLEAQRAAQAAQMATELVQRSEDNAYRDKLYNRDVFESDREWEYGVSRDGVEDSQWDKQFGLSQSQQELASKQANLNAAAQVSDITGKVVNPQSDWTGLFRQASNANAPLTQSAQNQAYNQSADTRNYNYQVEQDRISQENWMQQFAEQVRQNGLQNALSWANYSLAQDDNARGWAAQTLNEDQFTYQQLQDQAAAMGGNLKSASPNEINQLLQNYQITGQDSGGKRYKYTPSKGTPARTDWIKGTVDSLINAGYDNGTIDQVLKAAGITDAEQDAAFSGKQ